MNHKSVCLFVLAAVLLLMAVPQVRGQNLLQNPDFDSWSDESTATGWKLEYRPKAGTFQDVSSIFPPYCLKIERRVDSTGNNNGIKQDSIVVSPGMVYTLGAWLKADTLVGGTPHYTSGRIVLTWRDAGGAAIRSTNPSYVNASDWTHQLYTDTAPANAAMASVMVRCYGRGSPKSIAGGLVFVDHVEFFQGAGIAEGSGRPAQYADFDISPNPFGASTVIRLAAPARTPLAVKIYDAAGLVVREFDGAGLQEILWNGADESGAELPGGIYFATIENGGIQSAVRKVLLVR